MEVYPSKMKEKYLHLMELALSAYTDEMVRAYLNKVRSEGLSEHGFPRLTANIGILISHGIRTELLPLFIEMMDFCCDNIPRVKAANDFSVREIIACIWELERSETVSTDKIIAWRERLAGINPETCYNQVVKSPDDRLRNWVIFNALSEFYRQRDGLCDATEWVERNLEQQLQWFDENGMYRDNEHSEYHNPMVYDLVPRALLSLLLDSGYRGKYYERIDSLLKSAGVKTLLMQSANGEIPFGGRSNQFAHNEPWLVVVYEYEAKRYAREGRDELCASFKSAIERAIAHTEYWLTREPIYHTKNRYPTETRYGCEDYAYFDKYMITVASMLYMAYEICDDTLDCIYIPDTAANVFETSEYFSKLFLKCGGYSAELELNGDERYDASGLGRVHKIGAPSAICMSLPCPKNPKYKVDIEHPTALSLCSALPSDDGWVFGADSALYEVTSQSNKWTSAEALVDARFFDGRVVKEKYTVDESGVSISVRYDGDIAFALPAFEFDGERESEITLGDGILEIKRDGWCCRYTVSGEICDTGRISANRNGHYRAYLATAKNKIDVKVEIFEIK